MRLLVIFGSPKKDGNTQKLLNAFLSGIGDCEIKMIDSYDCSVAPCTDCGYCMEKPSLCVINDYMQDIYNKIEWAEVIIVAAPIYYNCVPAPLKAIIDRTMCLFCRRYIHKIEPISIKQGVMLVTAGMDREDGAAAVKSQLKMMFDVMGAKVFDSVFAMSCDKGGIKKEALKRAKEAGKRLFESFNK
jgi:multimeric flavodoxin WrbA